MSLPGESGVQPPLAPTAAGPKVAAGPSLGNLEEVVRAAQDAAGAQAAPTLPQTSAETQSTTQFGSDQTTPPAEPTPVLDTALAGLGNTPLATDAPTPTEQAQTAGESASVSADMMPPAVDTSSAQTEQPEPAAAPQPEEAQTDPTKGKFMAKVEEAYDTAWEELRAKAQRQQTNS